MVTKRKPPKQDNVQGAPAKPARPSVKGKAVARSTERPKMAAKPGDAPEAKAPVGAAGTAASGAGRPATSKAAGQAQGNAAASGGAGKPKRRIAMPQSSTRLKRNQAANGSSASAAAGSAAAPAGEGGASSKPTPRTGKPTKARKPLSVAGKAPTAETVAASDERAAAESARAKLGKLKRFSVAKADKKASDEAKDLEGKVSVDDASQAEDAARSSIAAEAAKRRLERRQRMMKHAESEPASQPSGLEAPEGAEAEGQAARPEDGKRVRKTPAIRLSWPVVVALTMLAVAVVCVGVFSWGRWLRYDDASDFQGLWYANGTTSVVTVDGQKINLTEDVAYDYKLDTGAKTITFTFGNLQGQGRYRFSVDRSELVITDGSGFTFWGNLFDDIGWQLDQAIRSLQGQEIQREAVVDGVTVLDRTPTQGASSPTAQGSSGKATSDDEATDQEQAGQADPEGGQADLAADEADGEAANASSGDVDGSEGADSAGNGSSSGFTGAVAEGGIDSAGSNAVTLEQLKSGSLQ